MRNESTIQEGDIGTQIIVLVLDGDTNKPVDLSGNTQLRALLFPPNNTDGDYRPATLLTDGTDGQVVYQSATKNDFSPAGSWGIRIQYALPNWSGHSSRTDFTVNKVD